MADIDSVIKIPEDNYKAIVTKYDTFSKEMKEWGLDAIKNGTVLLKGHGRLIDADALEKKMCDREEKLGDDRAVWESSALSVALDMFAPTIIPAERSDAE
jgi:hypothetical protein